MADDTIVDSPVSIKPPISPWSGTSGTTYGKSAISEARTRFYDAFRKESIAFDRQRKSHDTEYNFILLVTSFCAANLSAFVQHNKNTSFSQILTDPTPEQALLFHALVIFLFVAFLAILAKQASKRSALIEIRDSSLKEGRYRARRVPNVNKSVVFALIIEWLVLAVNLALVGTVLLLLRSVWTMHRSPVPISVATVASCIGLIVLAIPVPTWLTIRSTGTLIPITRSLTKDFVDTKTGRKPPVRRRSTMPPKKPTDPLPSPVTDEAAVRRFLIRETEREGYETDSQCVSWMFARNIDSDVSNAILGFIPEIVWHSGIQSTPLIQVYDVLLQCFSPSTEESKPVLIPHMREKATDAAKAFIHLFIQRQCIGDEDQELIDQLKKKSNTPLSWRKQGNDQDLDSMLGLVDKLLEHDVTISWNKFVLSFNHHSWLSHILLYRAWDTTRDNGNLTPDVAGFIEYTMALDPPAASAIETDCLLMIGLLVGIPIHTDDLLVSDKSEEFGTILKQMFVKLGETFSKHTEGQNLDAQMEALRLVTPMIGNQIAQLSYELFHTIMASSIPEDLKWEAARLTMNGAYNWDKYLPWVEDPKDVLAFLEHHFELQAKGENQDTSITNALRALAYASGKETMEALKKFDCTKSGYVKGICRSFKDEKPFQLRKAILFYIPLVESRWFDPAVEVLDEDGRRDFCQDWASGVDGIEQTKDVKKAVASVLFGMANSAIWRAHIPQDKWKLMEYFNELPDESPSRSRCEANEEFVPALKAMDNRGVLKLWLAILWRAYADLKPVVRDQLVENTREVIETSPHDVGLFMAVMESEKTAVDTEMLGYSRWSIDEKAIKLREKTDKLQQAKKKLEDVVESVVEAKARKLDVSIF